MDGYQATAQIRSLEEEYRDPAAPLNSTTAPLNSLIAPSPSPPHSPSDLLPPLPSFQSSTASDSHWFLTPRFPSLSPPNFTASSDSVSSSFPRIIDNNENEKPIQVESSSSPANSSNSPPAFRNRKIQLINKENHISPNYSSSVSEDRLSSEVATKRRHAYVNIFQERWNIPIIAVTASVTAEDEEKCRRSGMDFVIPKPISLNIIKTTLTKLFGTPSFTLHQEEALTAAFSSLSSVRKIPTPTATVPRLPNRQNSFQTLSNHPTLRSTNHRSNSENSNVA